MYIYGQYDNMVDKLSRSLQGTDARKYLRIMFCDTLWTLRDTGLDVSLL